MKKIAILFSFFSLLVAFPANAQKWINKSSIYMSSIPESTTNKTDHKSGYQGELNFGYVVDGDYSRPFIESIHGFNMSGYAFAGVGFGLQYAYKDKWNGIGIPLFVNLKGMYPVTENFSPYITLSLGYNFFTTFGGEVYQNYLDGPGGFYNDLGVGIKYKAFNLSLGMQVQNFNVDSESFKDALSRNNSGRYSYASYEYEYERICDIFYDGEDYNEDEIISKLKNVGFYIKLGVMF